MGGRAGRGARARAVGGPLVILRGRLRVVGGGIDVGNHVNRVWLWFVVARASLFGRYPARGLFVAYWSAARVGPHVGKLHAVIESLDASGTLDSADSQKLYNLHRDLLPILKDHARIVRRLANSGDMDLMATVKRDMAAIHRAQPARLRRRL